MKGILLAATFERLPARVIVAIAAIPLIVFAVFEGGYLFFLLVSLISAIALWEFYGMARQKGAEPLRWFGVLAGLLVNAAFLYERLHIEVYGFFADRGIHLKLFSSLQFLLVVLVCFMVCSLLAELFRRKGSSLLNMATGVAGILVIALPLGLLVGLRELYDHGFPYHIFFQNGSLAGEDQVATARLWGGWTILSVFGSLWVCDTAAYFAGSWLGTHKLFPSVSPGKTWEGAVAGFLGALIVWIAARSYVLPYLSAVDAVIIGVIVGVFGQMGDLIESKFKRDAGIKDSSTIIPGHGGVYDRFDSLVFVAPFVYLYIDFIVFS